MLLIVGYILILGSAIGTYAIHGSLAALWMPTEYIAIAGLFVGGLVASNSGAVLKKILGALPGLFKGSPYTRAYYMNVLGLLFEILSKVRKEGLMSIENDVENPASSPLFARYPEILADHHVLAFITDYLRMMVGGNLNTLEIENLMEQELEAHHHEAALPGHQMNKAGDALPAFGIVVAVMGVVNVMGSVGEPPPVLGKMIGGALVGTFLGILLSYGFVQPIASQLELKANEGSHIYHVVKAVLLASMSGYAPQVAIEFGRKNLPSDARPTFLELEEDLKNRKNH
ncbi:MAG: flagellar motor stator protein MotA [Zoogloeaceae bacterium]|jgi:chemotaxis protein MotA|nr:flagellar motor stator protein MotA [Zoogloeaceae bacterium]